MFTIEKRNFFIGLAFLILVLLMTTSAILNASSKAVDAAIAVTQQIADAKLEDALKSANQEAQQRQEIALNSAAEKAWLSQTEAVDNALEQQPVLLFLYFESGDNLGFEISQWEMQTLEMNLSYLSDKEEYTSCNKNWGIYNKVSPHGGTPTLSIDCKIDGTVLGDISKEGEYSIFFKKGMTTNVETLWQENYLGSWGVSTPQYDQFLEEQSREEAGH